MANIVFQGRSKKGREFIIRYPEMSDLEEMTRYINELSKEKTFIRYQGEDITLEYEKKFLDAQITRIKNKTSVQLLVFHGDTLIGNSGIDLKDRTEAHEGVFGISIAKDFRGEGIGKILMEQVIKEGKKNMPGLRIITLGVFATNNFACTMYENLGFKEYGRLPEGLQQDGKFIDHIYMYKKIV